MKYLNKYKYLSENAFKLVKNFTWDKGINKILELNLEKKAI